MKEYNKRELTSKLCEITLQGFQDELIEEDIIGISTSICISVDYLFFLDNITDYDPSSEDVVYINYTIKAGIDFFFKLFDCERINVEKRRPNNSYWKPYADFYDIKNSYICTFDKFCDESITCEQRLSYLVDLCRLMIIFMGYSVAYESLDE